jgi:large subunit ribosomal protein L35
MPKMKTHSGAKKRFKKTGKGKIMHEQANNQHMYEQKSSRRKRRLDIDQTLSKGDTKIVKRLLGQR